MEKFYWLILSIHLGWEEQKCKDLKVLWIIVSVFTVKVGVHDYPRSWITMHYLNQFILQLSKSSVYVNTWAIFKLSAIWSDLLGQNWTHVSISISSSYNSFNLELNVRKWKKKKTIENKQDKCFKSQSSIANFRNSKIKIQIISQNWYYRITIYTEKCILPSFLAHIYLK